MPEVVSELVQVFVVRESEIDYQLLLLRRARDPAKGLWQPIWGHIKPGEARVECAFRETREEAALTRGAGLIEAFHLDGVHPFYIAGRDAIHVSPCFLFIARRGWEPSLNDEHDAHEWTLVRHAARRLAWPGQRESLAEIVAFLSTRDELGTAIRAMTRLDLPT